MATKSRGDVTQADPSQSNRRHAGFHQFPERGSTRSSQTILQRLEGDHAVSTEMWLNTWESHYLGADPVIALISIAQARIESASEERRLVAPQCDGIVLTHYAL